MKLFELNFKNILIRTGILLGDLAVYIFLGLLMMQYDDFYEVSKGPYGSWGSMTGFDKGVVLALWGWHAVNILSICFLLSRFIKRK